MWLVVVSSSCFPRLFYSLPGLVLERGESTALPSAPVTQRSAVAGPLISSHALVLAYEYQSYVRVITPSRHTPESCERCDPEEVNEATNAKHVEPPSLLLPAPLLLFTVKSPRVTCRSDPAARVVQVQSSTRLWAADRKRYACCHAAGIVCLTGNRSRLKADPSSQMRTQL